MHIMWFGFTAVIVYFITSVSKKSCFILHKTHTVKFDQIRLKMHFSYVDLNMMSPFL